MLQINKNILSISLIIFLGIIIGSFPWNLPIPLGIIAVFLAGLIGFVLSLNVNIGLIAIAACVMLNLKIFETPTFVMTILRPLGLWVFFSWIIQIAIFKKKRFIVTKQSILILSLIILMLLSLFFVENLSMSIKILQSMIMVFIFYFLFINVFDSQKLLNNLLKVMILSGIIACFFGFAQFLWGIGYIGPSPGRAYYYRLMGRATGLIDDPNYFAMNLIALVPLAIFYFANEKYKLRSFFWGISSFILILGVFTTLSRAALIGLLAVLLLMLFRNFKKVFLLYIVISIILASLIITLLPGQLLNRLSTFSEVISSPIQGYSSIAERKTLLQAGLKVFLDHPFTGVGIGNSSTKIEEYTGLRLVSHNTYIDIAAETGILGITLFFSFIFSTLQIFNKSKKLFRSKEEIDLCNTIQTSFIGLLVLLFFLTAIHVTYFWIFSALSIILLRLAKKERLLNEAQ